VDVLANDDDPDADALEVIDSTNGAHGSVDCATATCTYTPEPDFHGTDSFGYTVADPDGATDDGSVTVTVEAVNDAPAAAADVSAVAAGGEVVLAPLANDAPGPPNEAAQTLTLHGIAGEPAFGTATLLGGGRIAYRPPAGYSGPEWLEYEVCDDGRTGEAPDPRCATGSVRIGVSAVSPTAETAPMANSGDAADDAAVWAHPTDPGASRVIGTDKGGTAEAGGLGVYDLSGALVQFVPGGRLNNVDVRSGFPMGGGTVALVAASDRTNRSIALFRVVPATGTLVALGPPVALGFEPYGLCLYRRAVTGSFYAFVTRRDSTGLLEQWELRDGGDGTVAARRVRSFSVGSLSEGCVADDELDRLYIGEEDVGIWRYGAEPDAGSARTSVDVTGSAGHLDDDVEGLALATEAGGGGFLVAVSQSADEYEVYERGGSNRFVRSFTVTAAGGVDGTSGIDGIDVSTASLGPSFPHGLLVSHDGTNSGPGGSENQNFKLVPLERVLPRAADIEVGPRPESCSRPYSDSSPWNVPIGPRAALDPESALHLTAFATSELTSDPTQFTYPVYEVTRATPRVPVHVSGWYSDVSEEGTRLERLRDRDVGVTVELPIPPGAEAAAGSDAQVILTDVATGDEWGVWQLEQTPSGWSATNGYHYDTDWSGVPPYEDGDPGEPFMSRGAGVPYLAGLVRPCELARGRIEHALAFAYDFPTHERVYPATKSDGNAWDGSEDELDSHEHDVPEGTRLQLDPALTAAAIKGWGCTGACLTIARALQTHGMYVIDNSSRPKVMLEYEGTARWNGVVGEDTVRPIPFSAFRVLAPPAP